LFRAKIYKIVGKCTSAFDCFSIRNFIFARSAYFELNEYIMQNKGIVKLFAGLLSLVCIYQLSFTYFAGNVEKAASEAYTNGEVESEQRYLDSVANLPVTSLFNMTYKDCKENELNLGLDLKGGMNVILEVSVEDIIKGLVGNPNDPLFNAAIANAKERQKDSQDDFITSFVLAFEEENQKTGGNAKFHSPEYFGTQELTEKFSRMDAEDAEVIEIVRVEAEGAIDRAFTILRTRIDKFGVAQPNIQKLQQSGRILIELPGVKDADRIKKLLQTTAQLEFWETREASELMSFVFDANTRLQETEARPDSLKLENQATESSEGEDDLADLATEDSEGDDVSTDSLPDIDRFNPLMEIFTPNVSQGNGGGISVGRGPVIGYAKEENIAKINAYFDRADIRKLLPTSLRYTNFRWTAQPIQKDSDVYALVALKSNRFNEPKLAGDVITDASANFDPTGGVSVDMAMNSEGAQAWKKITKNNVGKSVAVVLDDLIYSYPTVNGEIAGGRSSISGNFDINEGKDLANVLKAGKLPAKARIIQADVVGPSLGQRAIDAGVISFMIALGLILVYMLFYYSNAGVAANIALIMNMFFIFGVLAGFKAVLTLPGIAGIVLTIGMAVDANVLIFERIKEERASGKSMKNALEDGYRHAYAAIIDANVTTLLTGIVLAWFGTGPIRGFATTLIIGILTSLFTSIFLTRLYFSWRIGKGKEINFATGVTKNWFTKMAVDFMVKRKLAYVISGLIIVGGLGSIFTKGFDKGVDFSGGRSYVVSFDNNVNTEDIRQTLGTVFIQDGNQQLPTVKTFGNDNQVKITTKYLIDKEDADKEVDSKLAEGLQTIDASFKIESSQLVGPTIADDIKKSAFWSVLISLFVIFLYIFIRFGKWQFSMGAVAAVFHDVLIVLSIFSLLWGVLPFSLEIDQAFIAAILTVIGYSLNDTVVVFDRIRERIGGKGNYHDMPLINKALNSTLSRTINTSLTTILVLLVIFLLGGEVIQGFMFALLIGVVVGTYSSLFIATPVMLDTIKKRK
jgi:SecD/SecF fusion protein